ncbi:DEAD/DEAH box helicase family protein [Adlercreutzia sp. ZJ242]|uniref:type I restriction enzyme subunit R domain-containing protein n=1 Tax=Adlercreutzia sp. ZJ242 TaxID=2709409 RepID=UPI0013EDBC24|nr:DEAD/DEAH box helicase family protein [Adlercreutzia sp. ZJ242]
MADSIFSSSDPLRFVYEVVPGEFDTSRLEVGNPLSERSFQRYIIDKLVGGAGYVERIAAKDYDPVRAMDVDMLFDFLDRTQPESMGKLHAMYDGGSRQTILAKIADAIAKDGLLRCLWHGVAFDSGIELSLVYPKPAASFDAKAMELFDENTLSVMEEVYHKEGERIDLVVFLNGLAVFTFELKCESSASGWDYREAIRQYQEDRDPKTRLLMPKVGALAHFAMDLHEVWMCASLAGTDSKFLPFNQGVRRDGMQHETEAGNPQREGAPATAYMWEEVLAKGSILELIYDFAFIAPNHKTRKSKDETPIFPRYQQMRAVRRVAQDMRKNGTLRDYLIEHSAGSGKTNTIGWLAHKLAGLYGEGDDDLLFSKVLIVTDRIVIDRQLQRAVQDMNKSGDIVRVIETGGRDDAGETSKATRLKKALKGGYRIIVCTLGSFLNLEAGAFDGTGERFAVLIDEAHGSTSGDSMKAVNAALSDVGGVASPLETVSDLVAADIARSGKQKNMSIVGFTATPTGRTLDLFGTTNKDGKKEAFDLYSMRQAIEEGFILDVTSNYTTFNSYCRVVKSIEDDPELETAAAKRELARMIACADGTIKSNLEIMVNHFVTQVAGGLGGKAKAMIVTSSREAAVRYRLAFDEMRRDNMGRLGACQALVAFSDKIVVDGVEYTERGMNGGLAEDKLPEAFNTDGYRILIVADKYQTGFDQRKLAAMYVDKKLHGLSAVQTLSRLNRICPPFEKRTFVLDFKNSYEGIAEAFAPYYENTILENPLTLSDLRETERHLRELCVLDADDVREFYRLLAKKRKTGDDKGRMWALLGCATRAVAAMEEEEADRARRIIRHFVKQYAFLSMSAPFKDEHMHMEYRFCQFLIKELNAGGRGGGGIDLTDKVTLEDFGVEKTSEHKGEALAAEPEVSIARGIGMSLTKDQMDTLSKIVAEWNARYGRSFDPTIAAGSLVALKETLKKDEKIRRSAKVNTKRDFVNTLDDQTEAALVENYDKNTDWYAFLLDQREIRKDLIHILVDELFEGLSRGR